MRSVGLVSMPFGPLFSPSIALSLLKSALTRDGINSRIHYFTVRFAELVGSKFYLNVSGGIRPSMTKLAIHGERRVAPRANPRMTICGNQTRSEIALRELGLRSEYPGGAGAITHPDLRVAPALQRVARRVDGVEKGLFPVEIGAVHGTFEPDDPPRIMRPPAHLERHDRH